MKALLIPIVLAGVPLASAQKQSLGEFTVLTYLHQESFAGKSHYKATDALRVKQGGQVYAIKLPTRLESRLRKHGRSFHEGDTLQIVGVKRGEKILTTAEDVKRFCTHGPQ